MVFCIVFPDVSGLIQALSAAETAGLNRPASITANAQSIRSGSMVGRQ